MSALIIILLLAAIATEIALRAIWDRLPKPSRFYQPMHGPKVTRMQALADGPPIDIVLIGHSVTAIAIDPKIVLESLPEGATCFNAATGMANLAIMDRFLGEYVLPLLRPRLVILGTDSGALNVWDTNYREKIYDKAWATSKTPYGKLRRLVTSHSRLLDAINCLTRDADYRSAIWRRLQRKSGVSASERVDKHISNLGHRSPLRPDPNNEFLADVGLDYDVFHYEPGQYKTDALLRIKTRLDSQPNSRLVGLMMPSSPRETAKKLNGMADHEQGQADWAEFCAEQDIFTIHIDDGSYTDEEFGDLRHSLWPAVRRQSKALGDALAENWDELMDRARASHLEQ